MPLNHKPVSTTAPSLDYRTVFGWPVHSDNGGLTLVVGSGIAAVALPKAAAEPVLHSLARQGCAGPALTVPTKDGMLVILLAEADALLWPDQALPPDVRILTAGTPVPLPDERRPDDLARWVVPPEADHRWLPGLAAILTTIRKARPVMPRSGTAQGTVFSA